MLSLLVTGAGLLYVAALIMILFTTVRMLLADYRPGAVDRKVQALNKRLELNKQLITAAQNKIRVLKLKGLNHA